MVIDSRAGRGYGVKLGQPTPNPTHQPRDDRISGKQRRKHPSLRQAAHPDGRLDGPPRTANNVGAISLDDVDHPKVHIRAEAAVEADLIFTVGDASLERREVEKPDVNWLLDLVGERPGKDDPGDVRLLQLDVIGRVRIGLGLEQ
jgi:hypothetical protein